jgi:hypothetical protein
VAGGRSFPPPVLAGCATLAPGHLRRLVARIDKYPVPGIDRLYLLLPCLAPPPVFRRVLVLRAKRFYLAAGSSAGAVARYAAYGSAPPQLRRLEEGRLGGENRDWIREAISLIIPCYELQGMEQNRS